MYIVRCTNTLSSLKKKRYTDTFKINKISYLFSFYTETDPGGARPPGLMKNIYILGIFSAIYIYIYIYI